MKKRLALLVLPALLLALAACAPGGVSSADQISTAVAATLAADGQVVPTAEPTLGDVATQAPSAPACSNSGLLTVTYLKDDNVWLWVQGGMRTQLTSSGDAHRLAISSDGCRIAYTRSMPNPLFDGTVEFPTQETLNELWVVNSDGSNNHVLVDTAYLSTQPVPEEGYILSVLSFEFQPGSYNLAFNTQVLHPGLGLTLNQDLSQVEVDAAAVTPLLPAGQAGGLFAFSPDGAQIAMSTPTGINVVAADGSNLRTDLITFDPVSTYSEYAYTPPLNWAPDGSLMVAVPPSDPLAPPVGGVSPETALWWIPLDGTPAFQAGGVQAAPFMLDEVAFSPDVSRIAYLRQLDAANNFELVVAFSNGSNESPSLAGPEIRFVAWAADSLRYLYSYNDGALHLMLGNANDPAVQPVSTLNAFAAMAFEARWVDGDRFMLVETGAAGGQLSLLNVSGAGEVIDTFALPFITFDIAK
jgi:hypothetical protein